MHSARTSQHASCTHEKQGGSSPLGSQIIGSKPPVVTSPEDESPPVLDEVLLESSSEVLVPEDPALVPVASELVASTPVLVDVPGSAEVLVDVPGSVSLLLSPPPTSEPSQPLQASQQDKIIIALFVIRSSFLVRPRHGPQSTPRLPAMLAGRARSPCQPGLGWRNTA